MTRSRGAAKVVPLRSRRERTLSPAVRRAPRGTRAAARRDGVVVPPALKPGDLVGVVAPGSAVPRDALEAGLEALGAMGLRVRTGASARARRGTFAGTDALRGRDLAAHLADEDVRAVLFARGGWGTSRILSAVPWSALAARPKLLVGYSDLTSLFAPAFERCKLSCIYGPHAGELGDPAAYDRASLERALFHPHDPLVVGFPARAVIAAGRASGRIIGGTLTILAHLVGTPYAPRLRGRVLLIEEIREAPYRIDRMLTQMALAGALDGIAGVLVGSLEGCAPPEGTRSASALEVIAERFGPLGVPVVAGLRIGHVARKLSVPLGFRATIDTARRRIVLAP